MFAESNCAKVLEQRQHSPMSLLFWSDHFNSFSYLGDKNQKTKISARRWNQSILKEINPESPLEGLMLKLQYFGHLIQRVDSLEKTLMLGGIGGRRSGRQRMRWLVGITDSMDMSWVNSGSFVMDREAWRAAIHGVTKSRTRLSDWTELKRTDLKSSHYKEKSYNYVMNHFSICTYQIIMLFTLNLYNVVICQL